MDSDEFTHWIAMERIEPGEPFRTDVRFAMIASLIANAMSGKGRRYGIDEFMPFREKQKPSPKDLWSRLVQWGHLHNAKANATKKRVR